jgi:hypothetical protein
MNKEGTKMANETKEKEKSLYTWNWGGDGYNQTYAYSKKEALENAKKCSSSLYPTMCNFRRVGRSGSKAVEAFWKGYPLFD